MTTLDVPRFKQYLVDGSGSGKDELLEELYRAYDLCTERGHEDLLAACRDSDYDADPHGELPVECLSLKVRTEHEEAFNLAYDRNALWQVERFSIYRGPSPRDVRELPEIAEHRPRRTTILAGPFGCGKSSMRWWPRSRATGLGGRKRTATDDRERARKAVSAAIRRALKAIATERKPLWQHLRAGLKIGEVLCYQPGKEVKWLT